MDSARPSASIMMKTKFVHGFDHTANWMAKVRNVSMPGSHVERPNAPRTQKINDLHSKPRRRGSWKPRFPGSHPNSRFLTILLCFPNLAGSSGRSHPERTRTLLAAPMLYGPFTPSYRKAKRYSWCNCRRGHGVEHRVGSRANRRRSSFAPPQFFRNAFMLGDVPTNFRRANDSGPVAHSERGSEFKIRWATIRAT
jgi:hypothetical protein